MGEAHLGYDVSPCSNIEPSRHTMGDNNTVEQGNAESPGSDGASPYQSPRLIRLLPYPVALPWPSLPQLAMQKSMKIHTILAVGAAALARSSSALGDKYSDLVAKGYRWAIADGLYACVSKDDVRRMVNNPGDESRAKMVEEVRVLSDAGNDRSVD
jgi:hypothetical protein